MWCQFMPPAGATSLVILLSLPHSLTHHGFTLPCDGARCQLVSSTCRCGSLVQASAGCEIGHLTFVHELCMAPLSAETRAHRGTDMLLWPKVDLYGMATLCGRSKGEGCDTNNTSSLDWVLKSYPYREYDTLPWIFLGYQKIRQFVSSLSVATSPRSQISEKKLWVQCNQAQ